MNQMSLQTVPLEWQEWISECLIHRIGHDVIYSQLAKMGLDVHIAQQFISEIEQSPLLLAARKTHRQMLKRDWLLGVLNQTYALSASLPEIERRHRLSSDEFYEKYYRLNQPVIITGVVDHWEALTRWTPTYLKSKYGDIPVEVQWGRSQDPLYEHHPQLFKQMMSFAEYIDKVTGVVESNDFYLTGNNRQTNQALMEKLSQYIDPIEDYMNPSRFPDLAYLWFGPKGTLTKLHHDINNTFLVQLYGRKFVKLISPLNLPNMYHYNNFFSRVDLEHVDLSEFPLFGDVVGIREVTLYPGEILFLPVIWWHHIKALEISISVSLSNFRYHNDYKAFYDTYGYIEGNID